MKHYPVVGVLERLNQTLYVLEEKLPQYFKGANGLYFNKGSKIQTFSNKMKKSVSWQVRNTIVKRINNEIEFYNFCVKRLQHQYDEILSNQNLNKCIKWQLLPHSSPMLKEMNGLLKKIDISTSVKNGVVLQVPLQSFTNC